MPGSHVTVAYLQEEGGKSHTFSVRSSPGGKQRFFKDSAEVNPEAYATRLVANGASGTVSVKSDKIEEVLSAFGKSVKRIKSPVKGKPFIQIATFGRQ